MASSAAKVIWGENETNTTTTTSDDTTANENQKPLTETTANPAATTNTSKMNTETQGQEPVSGKLGDTSKGEPFDAGNIGSLPPVTCESRTIIFLQSIVFQKKLNTG